MCYSVSMSFCVTQFVCVWLISSFILFWSEKMLDHFSLLKLLRLVLCPNVVYPRKCSMCTWKECIFCCWGEMLWRYQLDPSDIVCHLRLLFFCCWIFFWKIYPLMSMGYWNPLLWLYYCLSPFMSVKICFTYIGTPVLL